MTDFITSIGIDPPVLLWIMLLSSLIFTLLYKNYVVSIFDPMVFFIVSMVADTSLMFALPWPLELKWEFSLFAVFVWIGFVISAPNLKPHPLLTFDRRGLLDLEVVLLVLCAIIVLANLYLGISTGFPLFSSNPSGAKVTSYSGGVGMIRRINMGPYTFFCCGCVYLAVINYKRRLALIMVALSTAFIALSGSKGALLVLLYSQALLLAHPGLKKSWGLVQRMRRYIFLTLVAGVGVALAVTIRDLGSIQLGVEALARRLLLTGDGIIYYYGGRERIIELTDRSLRGYWHYLTNDTLAMLRFTDYDEPLGSTMLGTGNNGYGPNAQSFLRADLFFGPVWGCLYSMTIGFLMGLCRTSFFRVSRTSPIVFVFRLMLAVSAVTLFVESEMFLNSLVMATLFVMPLWLFARIVPMKKVLRPHGLSSSLLNST